jgi:hypothetical protein
MVVCTVKVKSPDWAAASLLEKTVRVATRGFTAIHGFGKFGFMSRISFASSSLRRSPPPRLRESAFPERFQEDG